MMSRESSLFYAILCHIDPIVSLLGPDEIIGKVKFFKEHMRKNYDAKAKELGIRGRLVLEDDETILFFLSKLLQKNIIVLQVLAAKQFHYAGDTNDVLVLQVDDDGMYRLDSETQLSTKECIALVTAGYENMLVKDLKRIAKTIGIPKTSAATKPALLQSIKAKIDLHI